MVRSLISSQACRSSGPVPRGCGRVLHGRTHLPHPLTGIESQPPRRPRRDAGLGQALPGSVRTASLRSSGSTA